MEGSSCMTPRRLFAALLLSLAPLFQAGCPGGLASDGADASAPADMTAFAPADLLPACVPQPVPVVTAPGLLWDGDKAALLKRVAAEPFATVWKGLQSTAASNPAPFSGAPSLYVRGNVAKAAALVGLVQGDAALLAKAATIIRGLPPDLAWSADLDDGLHVSDGIVGHAVALHLLHAAGPVDPAVDAAFTGFATKFYAWATVDKALAFGVWPNNHTTKMAGALGLAALVVPNAPGAPDWLGWSAAILDRLWTDYLFAPDGAYAEGPYYHLYQDISVAPFVVALHRALQSTGRAGVCGVVICANRRFWQPDCEDGPVWVGDLLNHPRLLPSADWLVDFVRPDGTLPPYGDSNPEGYPAAVYAGPLRHAGLAWMFLHHPFVRLTADLSVESITLWDDTLVPVAPVKRAAWLLASGTGMIKSGDGPNDRQIVLLAIPPAMTRAGHSHADALSLQIYDQGAPRLIDTGYSSWADHDKVDGAEQHNGVFIDGRGASLPGLLGGTPQPCGLAQAGGDWPGRAQMTTPDGTVTRQVDLAVDGTITVTDTAVFTGGGAHTLSARWHALGGLNPAEDPRGVFVPLADGGKWTLSGVTTWVRGAGPVTAGHELRNDGLAYGQIKQHRCVVIETKGSGQATLVTRIWIGPAGQSPPWK